MPVPDEESKTNTPPADTKAEQRIIDDPILSALADEFPNIVKADEKKGEVVAPEVKAAPEDKAVQEPPPEKKTEPSPKVGGKKREDARSIAKEVVKEQLAQVLPLPPEKKEEKAESPTPPIYDESTLNEDQVEEVADARFAEKLDSKNKGRADELLRYYKKVDEWVEAKKKEDGEFDPSSEEFVTFVKQNRPKWADAEKNKIRRARFKEEAKAEVMKDLEPKLNKVSAQADEARYAPEIEKVVDKFQAELSEKTQSSDPLEQEIYETMRAAATELAKDHLRLHHGLDKISDKNPQELRDRHAYLQQFIRDQANLFSEHGGDARTRDGKEFIPPSKYAELKQKNDPALSRHWTFTNSDVLRMLQAQAVLLSKQLIEQEVEKAKKRGFVRAQSAKEPKKELETPAVPPVKASATPAPGAVQDTPGEDANHPGREIVEILGLKDT